MIDERYIIQITSSKVNMPQRCPVCGEPADDVGTIPAISALDRGIAQEATRHMSFAGSGHILARGAAEAHIPKSGSVRGFSVPACEMHAISFQETARLRAPMGICNGLLIVITLFLTVSVIGSIALTGLPDMMTSTLLILSIIGIAITGIASGPSDLEKAVKVLDSSDGFGTMVLSIRNKEYADELLRINPMTAKLLENKHNF